MDIQTKDVLYQADCLQKRAHEIIAGTGILQMWEEVGKTYLVGSARFGLMTAPNIDFEIYVDEPDARDGFAVIREIAALPKVTQIQYHNFLGTTDPGLYWHIDYEDEDGVMWDFDNWLVSFSHPQAGMADAFASAIALVLTPDTRRTILELKTTMTARASEERPRGIDIYKAVLAGGVRNVEEFSRWQILNPPVPLELWNPQG